MKFRNLFALAAIMGGIGSSFADITVTIPESCPLSTLDYYYAPIKQLAEAKSRAERGIVVDSVKFVDSKAVIDIPTEANGYLYNFAFNENEVRIYVAPEENVSVNVESCDPFEYKVSGSALLDGMQQLNELEQPIMTKAYELNSSENPDKEAMQALGAQFVEVQKNFIAQNPGAPAAGVALMNLDGPGFISIYESLPESQTTSILYPLLKVQYEAEQENLEMEKKQQAMQSGDVDAPNFTLKDLEGKDVSLTDFRGKWVILDFWGSWCPWCIKGFPELKEAYEKYGDKLVIIGVDCKESEAEWRAGVEKYELPWVNVYNPGDNSLLNDYGVQGFPTKAIIGPDGKIRNITVGHDPEFFNVLASLLD